MKHGCIREHDVQHMKCTRCNSLRRRKSVRTASVLHGALGRDYACMHSCMHVHVHGHMQSLECTTHNEMAINGFPRAQRTNFNRIFWIFLES
jgi:hypothetical protein